MYTRFNVAPAAIANELPGVPRQTIAPVAPLAGIALALAAFTPLAAVTPT